MSTASPTAMKPSAAPTSDKVNETVKESFTAAPKGHVFSMTRKS